LVPDGRNYGHHLDNYSSKTLQLSLGHLAADRVWNFEWSIKPMKPEHSCWRKYVRYLIQKNPGTPLKKLLSTYSKKEYAEFKKNPKAFV